MSVDIRTSYLGQHNLSLCYSTCVQSTGSLNWPITAVYGWYVPHIYHEMSPPVLVVTADVDWSLQHLRKSLNQSVSTTKLKTKVQHS